jgi:hypothetical protein
MSSVSAAMFWKVTRGDTLYAISRNLFPGDAVKQKRVREDITKLNPTIFAKGANNLAVGAILQLPDYVVKKGTTAKSGEPVIVTKPVQKSLTPPPAPPVPVTESVPLTEPASVVEPAPVAEPAPESSPVSRQSSSVSSGVQEAFIVSIGFSLGGDELVEVDGGLGLDFDAGSGGHLRLGYERMSQQGRGYRAALGFQYNKVDHANFKNTYLQLAYQIRNDPIVYGIGIVADTGATLESFGDTTDFDPAIGGVVYMEYLGSNKSGLGLSYTAMDIEEEDSGASLDSSRIEFYYNWRL